MSLHDDDNGYRPGINGTKTKHFQGRMVQWFYPAEVKKCSWETEFERKLREKEESRGKISMEEDTP